MNKTLKSIVSFVLMFFMFTPVFAEEVYDSVKNINSPGTYSIRMTFKDEEGVAYYRIIKLTITEEDLKNSDTINSSVTSHSDNKTHSCLSTSQQDCGINWKRISSNDSPLPFSSITFSSIIVTIIVLLLIPAFIISLIFIYIRRKTHQIEDVLYVLDSVE